MYQPYQSTWNNPYLAQPTMPQYTAYQPTAAQPYQQPVNGVVRVNGRDSAVQYQLPPNSMSPALFDNNGKTFYIVSTDGTGMKTVEAFDFAPHKDEAHDHPAQYVSREEFDQFVAKVGASLEALNGVHAAVPAAGRAPGGDVPGPGGGEPAAGVQ